MYMQTAGAGKEYIVILEKTNCVWAAKGEQRRSADDDHDDAPALTTVVARYTRVVCPVQKGSNDVECPYSAMHRG